MKKNKENNTQTCPCESGELYANCCQPYLEKYSEPATAEALMRSRYTAFFLRDEAFLRHSWHPDTCPKDIHLGESTRWLGLKIKNTVAGGTEEASGEVEFIARSKSNGQANRLHENSHFVRFNGRWVYIDGKPPT